MERFVLEELNVKCEIDFKKKARGQLRIETEQNDMEGGTAEEEHCPKMGW